jgi:hypothetical protein
MKARWEERRGVSYLVEKGREGGREGGEREREREREREGQRQRAEAASLNSW